LRALILIALLLGSGLLRAEEPLGPAAPASAAELAAVKAAAERDAVELRKQLADALAQIEALRAAVARDRAASSAVQQDFAHQLEEVRERSRLSIRAGRLSVLFSGFVQLDAVAWRQSSVDELDPATGDPLNETRFLLRRARLRTELEYRFLFAGLEIDANTIKGPQVRPISFEVGAQYRNQRQPGLPYIAAHLGLVRTPFGFEVLQSDRDRLFLERSTVMGAFFPGEYDLGARVFGGWRFLRYALGVMNGDPIGERLFPGRDPTKSKDVVARVGIDLLLARVGVRAGFSAVWGQGFHPGVGATKDTLVWRDQNQNGQIDPGELISIPGQAYQPSSTFDRYALGGDLGLAIRLPRVGMLTLLGEIVYGVNMDRAVQVADPVASARDLRELGWYVGATQELTPYAAIGLRYDRYDPDRDSTDLTSGRTVPRDQTRSNLVVTAAARLPAHGRLLVEYSHVTNALGRRPDGAPTTLADDSFTIRAEAGF
jgi:hypothetical protein